MFFSKLWKENFYWDGIGQKTVPNKRACLWSRSDQVSYHETLANELEKESTELKLKGIKFIKQTIVLRKFEIVIGSKDTSSENAIGNYCINMLL